MPGGGAPPSEIIPLSWEKRPFFAPAYIIYTYRYPVVGPVEKCITVIRLLTWEYPSFTLASLRSLPPSLLTALSCPQNDLDRFVRPDRTDKG